MLKYVINPRMNRRTEISGGTDMNIDIPLGGNFSLDGMQDMLSNEKFFEKIKGDVLPAIVDKEKIVVYPAVYYVEPETGDEKFALADEIEINFHFRRRWQYRGTNRIITDGWSTDDRYGWTTGQTNCEEGRDYDGRPFDPTNYDEHSDLVGYLGFDDDDIYYQKMKVKKSFLRLMFYDSKNVLNKNLLAYSTSFLDSGKLFTKYSLVRNNDKLFKYVNETEYYENEMVMFEPGRQPVLETPKTDFEFENAKYDDLRLSSGIILKDKYNDDASSDGFYLYIFKQDAPSERPIDFYLKAEFNNAKYGKTLNLMMPISSTGVPIRFGDTGTTVSGETVDAFPMDFTIENESGQTMFDFDSYYNSLFINVKCKYDKTLRKFIYYFPWDPEIQKQRMEELGVEYRLSNDVENRKITLNFFEPRVNKVKIISTDTGNGGN